MNDLSFPSAFMGHILQADKWDHAWIELLIKGTQNASWQVDVHEHYEQRSILEILIERYSHNPSRHENDLVLGKLWDYFLDQGLSSTPIDPSILNVLTDQVLNQTQGQGWGFVQRVLNLKDQDDFDGIAFEALELVQRGGKKAISQIKKLHPDGWNYKTQYGVDLGTYILVMAKMHGQHGWLDTPPAQSSGQAWRSERINHLEVIAQDWGKSQYVNLLARRLLNLAFATQPDRSLNDKGEMSISSNWEDVPPKEKTYLLNDQGDHLLDVADSIARQQWPKNWMKSNVDQLLTDAICKQEYKHTRSLGWSLFLNAFAQTHHHLIKAPFPTRDFFKTHHISKWEAPVPQSELIDQPQWHDQQWGRGLLLLTFQYLIQSDGKKSLDANLLDLQQLSLKWVQDHPDVLTDQAAFSWIFGENTIYKNTIEKDVLLQSFMEKIELSGQFEPSLKTSTRRPRL